MRPTVFCIHFLAGSARGWRQVTERLQGECECVPVDLPGFGAAAGEFGYGVADMADYLVSAIRQHAPARWFLVGHSMGGKVAAVVARRAEDGAPGLAGLAGLVLLGASPPGPEPMEDGKRRTMMGWFAGSGRASRAEAQSYVDDNVGAKLPRDVNAEIVADVLLTKRDAWIAWLGRGSREDWGDRVGVLATPALIVSGSEDAGLGEAAQRRHAAPHYADHRFVTLSGAGHLLPMERPDEVARLIATQITPAPPIPRAYRALIDSPRVSTGTRAALMARATPDDPGYVPAALSSAQLATLRAVMARVLPQPGPGRIDLAARADAALAAGPGEGWRFDALPPAAQAWAAGLDTLADFAALDGPAQDAALTQVAAGRSDGGRLDRDQMRLWFEDVRAQAARLYVAHPATLARMAYSGIGYGGDGAFKPGFTRIGPGEREAWEPAGP